MAWNALVFAMTPIIVRYSAISAPAKELVIWLVLINNVFNSLAYPFAGPLGSGLRAAGDVKFTMWVSITLTIAARLLFSCPVRAMAGLGGHWGSRGYEHRLGVSGSSVPLAAAFPAMEPVPAHLTIWEIEGARDSSRRMSPGHFVFIMRIQQSTVILSVPWASNSSM